MTEKLEDIAQAMVAPGKGILAADESSGTIKKRFDKIGLASTDESRRDYREMLFRSTEAMKNHISGVITRSFRGRGFFLITPASAGSMPSASAGAPSVTRLIHKSCVASKGNTTPLASAFSPNRSASNTPKNMVSTSPMLDESR